ncbi:MAG: prephenate dehydratase [Alphaproteobacteria bacterium]|nr:prephenate dehydratase [Alphaproteobacteria bacterium]
MRITYQGIIGCFSSMVCEKYFPNDVHRSCLSFSDAINAVCNDEADVAVIPVENSTAGRVAEVYGILPEANLSIIGEAFLPIHHCLMMPTKFVKGIPPQNLTEEELLEWKKTPLTDIEISKFANHIIEVRSHPQGLLQCNKFLEKELPNARKKEWWDTAGSARDLAREMTPNVAVIAPKGAERYNMTILKENIEDLKNNTTRFLFLRKTALNPEELSNKPLITTLLFRTMHKAGALVEALQIFKKYNINMTKLETYMTGTYHSEPVFYVDVAMNQFDEKGRAILSELKEKTLECQILGTYETSDMRSRELGFLPVEE